MRLGTDATSEYMRKETGAFVKGGGRREEGGVRGMNERDE
jgi:hypothetical protein